ncbi:hypothetical protein MMT22_29365, partial [Escherichia coli]|nr:hypothetical protein [Escherichia coli]
IDALPYVEAGSNARTSDISSGEYAIMPLAPMKESDAPNEELRRLSQVHFRHMVSIIGNNLVKAAQSSVTRCCWILRARGVVI